jgi:protein ImuB
MRLCCVHVPQLALQAVLRRTPDARGAPAARLVPDGKRPPRVSEPSPEARRAGVRAGMTGAQAAAACPGVRLVSATPADVEAARAALADVGYAFAPRVDVGDEEVSFEVGDLGPLYPTGEAAIAQAVQARAARVGLGVRVAIASSKGIARVATRTGELAVVPPGPAGARAFLKPVPVNLLTADATLIQAMRRWGLRTAGDLAALPVAAVALRLGEAGARLCRLARGDDDEPFVPRLPADALEEAVDLDYPIAELEPLAFVLRGLVDRALARLACRSLACAGLTLRLSLDPRGLDVRTVPIAAPTRETATLLDLVRLDLARRPPAAPVVGVRIVALPARVRATQLDIMRPAGPSPDRLAATIARLAALVGPENVGAPVAEDTWREEAAAIADFELSLRDGVGRAEPVLHHVNADAPSLTIRRRRPPEEIEVLMGRSGPTALRGRETTARVLVAAGPYRLSGEWWRASRTPDAHGWAREYWDVHASDGAVYRVHQDQHDGRWYLDGYYD